MRRRASALLGSEFFASRKVFATHNKFERLREPQSEKLTSERQFSCPSEKTSAAVGSSRNDETTRDSHKKAILVAASRAVLLVVSGTLLSCAPTAFSPHFRDNHLGDLKAALADFSAPGEAGPINSTGRSLAFILTGSPTRILAFDLATYSLLWSAPAQVTSKIIVGRRLIFYRSGSKARQTLEARQISDGRVAWSHDLLDGNQVIGMTTDGEDVYYVTENAKPDPGGSVAFLVALSGTNGNKRWIRSSSGRLGAPAARNGRVFLPFRSQSLAVVDATQGRELARIRSNDETLSWVRSSKSGIQFGGTNGVYALDEKAVSGTRKRSSFISTAQLPLSVQAAAWWDGYNPDLIHYSAFDKNRLLWEMSDQGQGFKSNRLIVSHYRFLFAFDTAPSLKKQAPLLWAYHLPRHDIVSSTVTGDALVLVTATGDILILDARVGLPVLHKELKVPVVGASFDAEGLRLTAAPTPSSAEKNLQQSLSRILADPDRRFDTIKLFSIEQLGRLPGLGIAEDLVKIVTQEGIDSRIYERAGDILVARHDREAIPLYLQTLKSHYSFVEGTRGKAVDIMARALGDLKAPEAVRPLLLHLADHETPFPAVAAIVKALVAIGDPSVVEPFRDFLLTYRCDPDFDEMPAVLQLVAKTLLVLGGKNELPLLKYVENDGNTLQSLRDYLGKALLPR